MIREMKRKKEQRKKITIAAGIILCVIVAGLIGLFFLNRYNETYIMTFEGKKVSVDDLNICTMFTSEDSDVSQKDQAVDHVLTSQLVTKYAALNNVALTDEELQSSIDNAENYKQYYQMIGYDTASFDSRRMGEIIATMSTLYQKLLDIYTDSYTVDETDFRKEFNDYLQNSKADYYDIQIKYIITAEEEAIQDAYSEIEAGEDFDEVYIRYSVNARAAEDSGEPVEPEVSRLGQMGLPAEANEKILAMKPGEYSEPITLEGYYGIFYIISYDIPPEPEVEESFRERYTFTKKDEMFTDILNGWKEAADYKINQKAYDAA
jgi:parvulin-like peptidyl-prolyl isomerase